MSSEQFKDSGWDYPVGEGTLPTVRATCHWMNSRKNSMWGWGWQVILYVHLLLLGFAKSSLRTRANSQKEPGVIPR